MERNVEPRELSKVAPDKTVPFKQDDVDIAATYLPSDLGILIRWLEEEQRQR